MAAAHKDHSCHVIVARDHNKYVIEKRFTSSTQLAKPLLAYNARGHFTHQVYASSQSSPINIVNRGAAEQRNLGVQLHCFLKVESLVDRAVKNIFDILAFISQGTEYRKIGT